MTKFGSTKAAGVNKAKALLAIATATVVGALLSFVLSAGAAQSSPASDFASGEEAGAILGYVIASSVVVWLACYFLALRQSGRTMAIMAFASVFVASAIGAGAAASL